MKTCFLSIDVEKRQEDGSFEGVEKLDAMLDIFKKHNVSATFFVTGEVLERYSGLVKKWAEDFEIGCHSYYHTTLDKLNSVSREKQLKNYVEIYQKNLKAQPRGFRAPRNIIDSEQFSILEAYGFLYDSSVFSRYPWPFQKYEGYKGRAPVRPYWPSKKDYKSPIRRKASNGVKILEIPESPITFLGMPVLNVPLVATWLRKWTPRVFKLILTFIRPKYISFNMHSWDGVRFYGKSSRNSGKRYLKQLDEMLDFLKKIGYEFKSGEQIYESFSAQGGPASGWQKISKKEYKGLLEKVSFKTFFHKTEWHEFLEKEFKWLEFEYYLYNNKTIFPVAKVGNKLISLPFCEYGGPLGDFDEQDILKEFKNIKVKVHPMCEVEPHALSVGGSTSSISTYWIDLKNKSEKELLSSFRKTLRHSIRNSQKHGLKIKKCSNMKELKQFYNLYTLNLKRKKTVPYPYSVIKFLFEQSETEIWLALYKGKIIAGDLFLYYNPFVHYFLSASDYKYKKLGASYLILWEKIKSLIGKDIIFDFGAAPKGSQLETFKKGWRGKEYGILQIGIKRTEEGLRSSKLRNIYGLLPNWLIKKLSSKLIKYRI